MHCAYHPTNAANTQCAGCNRPLCASCDHRIKGYPHCEDCIVRGVDALRRGPIAAPVRAPAPVALAAPARLDTPSPRKAVVFGLFPGLGAVYNRQNLKALVHFLAVVGLGQTADATGLEVFGVASAAFFLYTLFDAYQTAKRVRAGMDPREDEARLKWTLARTRPLWGGLLCVLAVLVIVSTLPVNPLSPRYVWAGVLLAAGAYFITSYMRGARGDDPGATMPPVQPRSVVSARLTEELAQERYASESRAGNR
jgi:hypothetical protein